MRTLTVSLAALALLLLPAAASAQTAADPTPTLRVVGHGTAFVTPDTAEISAGARRVDRDRDAARSYVARRARRMLAALDAIGVARADVQTDGVSLGKRTYRKAPRVRWQASTSLSVTVRDVDAVATVIDRLADAGADDVDGPYFGISDPSAGAGAAEQAALADARRRADAIAASLGMVVAGVRSVDLSP
ncbi:MAG TPA: SIMPL domain-containing protein, partial [Capillimicrobium sp.]